MGNQQLLVAVGVSYEAQSNVEHAKSLWGLVLGSTSVAWGKAVGLDKGGNATVIQLWCGHSWPCRKLWSWDGPSIPVAQKSKVLKQGLWGSMFQCWLDIECELLQEKHMPFGWVEHPADVIKAVDWTE